jgi:hypothetical protein
MTTEKPAFVHYVAAPGILEGPYATLVIGEVTIEIFVRLGQKARIARHHGIRAREAAEQRPAHASNPCLVPLDIENEGDEGGPFVFARVTDGRFPLK